MLRPLTDHVRVDIGMAEFALSQADDGYVRQAAFCVQQAIEKSIKQVYVECGIDYRHTHSINSLLRNLPANQRYLSEESIEAVYECSDTLEKWELVTRYGEDYVASRRRVEMILSLAKKLQAEVLTAIRRQEQTEPVGDKPTLGAMHLDE